MDRLSKQHVPSPLAHFAWKHRGLDYDSSTDELFLYHGTNCYRRWEIKHSGSIEPGRNNYSFFSSNPEDAFKYARIACTRDASHKYVNSLIYEPVVLKVRFNARTWLQVDFVQNIVIAGEHNNNLEFSFAVLGPILMSNITAILYCTHDGRILNKGIESIRSFNDGTLMADIRHLRFNLMQDRFDVWMLKHLCALTREVEVRLCGKELPESTWQDSLWRLRQVQLRA